MKTENLLSQVYFFVITMWIGMFKRIIKLINQIVSTNVASLASLALRVSTLALQQQYVSTAPL